MLLITVTSGALQDTECLWINNLYAEEHTWVKYDVVNSTRVKLCVLNEIWYTS